MSKADNMFKELGYKIEETKKMIFIGEDIEYFSTDFLINKENKTIKFYSNYISFEELKAINEKVKELGWYE